MTRKYSLDNIRGATVLLVLFYHVCYLYNGAGVPGGIPGAQSIAALDCLAAWVYPWFMVLLFVIAGISARYSLEKRTGKEFLRERAVRLLVPSTLGLFVIHWITGYLNIRMGGGLEWIPSFLLYPISVLSGTGPLWFIQMLFLFSCLLVLLRKADASGKLHRLSGLLPPALLPFLALPVWLSSLIGNMPLLTMYRFGIYFAAFLIGYYILSQEKMLLFTERFCLPFLLLAIAGGIACAFLYPGGSYTAPERLQSLPVNCYLWFCVLAILGLGGKYFSKNTAFTDYMRRAGFGLYVLHYPVLLTICFFLYTVCRLPAAANYCLAFAGELVITPILYEILSRVPLVRFLVLGIRGKQA